MESLQRLFFKQSFLFYVIVFTMMMKFFN